MEMRSRGFFASVLSISLALSAASVPFMEQAALAAPSDDAVAKAEAKTRYDKGVKLYGEGAYEAALVEFQRAYDLNPSYKILYNIALIHQQLNDFVDALRNYQRYLEGGKGDIASARRTEVEKSIAQVKQNIATVTISVDLVGADITVDDVSVGKSPLDEAILVNAGRRRIAASRDKASATKVVVVAGGDTIAVDLRMAVASTSTEATPALPPPSTTVDANPKASGRSIPWVGWAITGGLAAGAVVTGVLALQSASTLASDRDTVGAPRSQLDDDQSKTKRWALITDVLAAGAIVAGGISLYLTLKKPSGDGKDTTSTTASTTAAVDHLRVGFGPGSVVLGGAF